MLVNSVAVIGIGVLVFPILKRHHEISAYGYLTTQVAQAVMCAVGIVFLLLRVPLAQEYAGGGAHDTSVLPALARVAQEGNHYSFWIAMISVGAGGLLLCRVLLRERLVPAFMAVWGGWPGTPSSWPGRCSRSSATAPAWSCPSRADSSKLPSARCSSRRASPQGRAATTKDWPATSHLP